MRKDIAGPETESTMPMWEGLEGVVREKAQEFIQQILEEEVTELLGREKSERKAAVDAAPGYRNGYGKARRLSTSSGTITVRRPRVRGLEERFESRVLPLFARRTKEVGAALLVVMGAMRDGTKEVLAVTSGYRESTDSWAEVFRGLKARGLAAPKLLMADGNAAIWGAARTVWPEAGEQRCWNHKMRNVLDRLPQREQSEAKELLRTVVYASTWARALKARQAFGKRYGPWYPKAVTVLEDDWDRMVTFYDFPAAHWKHLRTTNVVESPFASVRLRTSVAKRFKRVDSATALIWKLLTVAEKRFRRLDAPNLLKDVFEERKFRDGKPVSAHQRKAAA